MKPYNRDRVNAFKREINLARMQGVTDENIRLVILSLSDSRTEPHELATALHAYIPKATDIIALDEAPRRRFTRITEFPEVEAA